MKPIVGSDILATKLVKVVDHEITGLAARTARQQARLSLREIARRMGVSAAYVCDLEKGHRRWDIVRACRYATAVGANTPPRAKEAP
jgi:transcriptional regulator with XRE-family HTH domain